jgi:hypothetical protein
MENQHRQIGVCMLIWTILLLVGVLSLFIGHLPAQAQTVELDTYVFLPLVARDYDPTWQWTSTFTPTLSPAPYHNPLMTIDQQGQVHLLWDTITSQDRFIYHTYLITASTWTTPTTVAQSLGTSSVLYPPIVDSSGTIHLLWHNEETYNDPERALYAAFANGDWSAEEEVFRSPRTHSTLQGMVHLDASRQLHATLVDSYLASRVFHTVRTASSWSTPVEIGVPDHTYWIWPDRWGGVHFYGNDYDTPPNLYYSYWRDGSFVVQDRQATGQVNGRQTQLDGQNDLHIFWTAQVAIPGGNVTGIYHQCLDDDLQITSERVLSGQESASAPVKAANQARWFALAWWENSAERVRLAVWDGCTRIYLKTVPLLTDATWTPKALAVSDEPGKVCLLSHTYSYYPGSYRVICADILRH